MKTSHFRPFCAAFLGFAVVFALAATISMRALAAGESSSSPQLIQPAELVKVLRGPASHRPLLIQVGFRTLYEQAHIPGSEYVGPTSEPQGLQELHKRVQALPRNRYIVLYCGCCPWSHCPNVRPAYKELRDMGFSNVKVLYIASNFGADWVNKGYPVTRGN
jgi:thiosulfate/3-mercaptopyruvate sulfurtransferase